MSNRRLSLFAAAFTAAVLGTAAALPASAAPEPPGPGGVTDSALVTLIASVGDDVFSTTDVASLIDPTGASTQHFGPYPSTSPDSGTCGNNWASDAFDRHFTVHQNPDGTFTVVEQFKDGSFVTTAGASPGACQSTPPQGVIRDGVTGDLHGYFIIPLPPAESESSSPFCNATLMTNANCDTTTFINTHFTPACYPTTCFVTTFFFHYSAGDQSLLEHEWRNASSDRGGNSGDIRSSNA